MKTFVLVIIISQYGGHGQLYFKHFDTKEECLEQRIDWGKELTRAGIGWQHFTLRCDPAEEWGV